MIKCVLYNNKTEPIANIPLEFIGDITYRFNDINEFTLTIPKTINGKENPLFNKIKSRQQILLTNFDGTKDRYILKSRKTNKGKIQSKKSFVCYQFQKKLETERISINEGNYYLTKDGININNGILDIIADKIGWKIGNVDDSARYSDEEVDEKLIINKPSLSFENVRYDDLIFDIDVKLSTITNPYGKEPLYISFEYLNVVSNDYNYGSVYNDFEIPFYTDITNIKAYYYQEAGNRFALKYIFTLADKTKQTLVKSFINATDKKLKLDGYKITYTTGRKIKQNILKFPYFQTSDDNAYNILMDIEKVYDCIIDFDTVNKIINCYDRKTYGEEKGLLLSLDSNCISVEEQEDDEIPTGLKVIGKEIDGKVVTVQDENIFGGDILYNYDYYIKQGIIGEDCANKWNKYKQILEVKKDEWSELKVKSANINSALITIESKITSLKDKIVYTKDLLSSYVASKDIENQKRIQAELKDYEDDFNKSIISRDYLKTQSQEILDIIERFSKSLTRENIVDKNNNKIFTKDDLEILRDCDEILSITDDYYTTNYSLYNHYVKVLENKIKPLVNYTIVSANINEYLNNNNNLIKLGCYYYFDKELKNEFKEDKVRLTEITYSPTFNNGGGITNVVFSNKDENVEELKLGNPSRKINGVSNTINSYKQTMIDAQYSNNYVSNLRENGLNLATTTVNGTGKRNILDFSSAGIFIKDTDDTNNQMYIGSGLLAISTDGFKTSKTAITPIGVFADTLVGKLLLGENLVIDSENGCFYVGQGKEDKNKFGLFVYDKVGTIYRMRVFLGVEKQNNGEYSSRLQLYSIDGSKVVLSDEGIIQNWQDSSGDNLDQDNPLEFYINIDKGVSKTDKCELIIQTKKYRSYIKYSESSLTNVTTTESGSGSTTASGGTYSDGSDVYTNKENGHWHTLFGKGVGVETSASELAFIPFSSNIGTIYIGCRKTEQGGAPPSMLNSTIFSSDKDDVSCRTESQHTHYMPKHYHTVSNHVHNINVGHTHKLIHGVTELGYPEHISICINGKLFKSGIKGGDGTTYTYDIKDYVKVGDINKIRITSDSLGKINWTVIMKSFNKF